MPHQLELPTCQASVRCTHQPPREGPRRHRGAVVHVSGCPWGDRRGARGGGRTGDLACSAAGQSLGPGGNSDVPRGVLHTTSAHESCAGRLGWRGATQQWPSRSAAIPDDPNHRCALSALGRPPASLPKKKAGKDVRRVMSSSEGGRESVWVPTSSKNWVAS